MLTIVMYHYVRDLPNTPYPRIRGLLSHDFYGQLDYVGKHYQVCSLDEVMAAAAGRAALPRNACLLTFDDGLLDHYETVYPALQRKGMPGAFFPTVRSSQHELVLDVHKVHFILAVHPDPAALLDDLFQLIDQQRSQTFIPTQAELLAACAASKNRYDDQTLLIIKRLLQYVLPKPVRRQLASELFRRHVSDDEVAFARSLYMSLDHLRHMERSGMGVGGHGVEHDWLEHESAAEQAEEFEISRAFVVQILGREPGEWVMNYPYGSYNATTVAVATASTGCVLGLTTRPQLVVDFSSPFETHRIDTNDLPCQADALAVPLTQQVIN